MWCFFCVCRICELSLAKSLDIETVSGTLALAEQYKKLELKQVGPWWTHDSLCNVQFLIIMLELCVVGVAAAAAIDVVQPCKLSSDTCRPVHYVHFHER